MDRETPLQPNDNTTIGTIASTTAIFTGVTVGIFAAAVINIAILSLGTPILGPEITVLLNLTGGLYASFVSIKTSMNIADNYVTPTVRNILQSSVDYLAKSKSVQQDMQLPMIVPDVNKQLPVATEPDHLPMKVIDKNEIVAKNQKETKNSLDQNEKQVKNNKSSKPINLKKEEIKSKKNSDTKNKDNDKAPITRG